MISMLTLSTSNTNNECIDNKDNRYIDNTNEYIDVYAFIYILLSFIITTTITFINIFIIIIKGLRKIQIVAATSGTNDC